jgi:hypothetical protein
MILSQSRRLVKSVVCFISDSATVKVQIFRPPVATLKFRSTRDQRGNHDPILATVQLVVLVWAGNLYIRYEVSSC